MRDSEPKVSLIAPCDDDYLRAMVSDPKGAAAWERTQQMAAEILALRQQLQAAQWRPIADVLAEVQAATAKFPTWPTDPLHALAVLGEEFGELNKAMLQFVYEPHKTSRNEIRKEAVQTAAMALRLIASLPEYDYARCPQHSQPLPPAPPLPAREKESGNAKD